MQIFRHKKEPSAWEGITYKQFLIFFILFGFVCVSAFALFLEDIERLFDDLRNRHTGKANIL